jgi:hypothetical protein
MELVETRFAAGEQPQTNSAERANVISTDTRTSQHGAALLDAVLNDIAFLCIISPDIVLSMCTTTFIETWQTKFWKQQ